jgi:hypothetical protein
MLSDTGKSSNRPVFLENRTRRTTNQKEPEIPSASILRRKVRGFLPFVLLYFLILILQKPTILPCPTQDRMRGFLILEQQIKANELLKLNVCNFVV